MSSPLQFRGGIQSTLTNSITSVTLDFKSSFQTNIDIVLSNHVIMQFGSKNLALTISDSVVSYDASRMFMMF